jgi:hypothetical protein
MLKMQKLQIIQKTPKSPKNVKSNTVPKQSRIHLKMSFRVNPKLKGAHFNFIAFQSLNGISTLFTKRLYQLLFEITVK